MTRYTQDKLAEILRLHGLYLTCTLGGAYANLAYANLADADLAGANLALANLAGANLAYANLADADLAGAAGLLIASDADQRLLAVAQAALASPSALAMDEWHTCETTHCICGWAEHLGGALARLLIRSNGHDVGGLMLLGVEAHAHFYKSEETVRAFLRSVIDKEAM